MAEHGFQVYLSGGNVSLDAWREALDAPEEELPALSDAQREAARILGMAEPEYARGVLADKLGKEGQQEIGTWLGEAIEDFLRRLGQGWQLDSLLRRGLRAGWMARFVGPGIVDEVEIPADIADEIAGTAKGSGNYRLERYLSAKLNPPARRAAS